MLVIGAGNTAIDVATAAKRLGAEEVTIAYRRGEEAMPAFAYEYELAKADGVRFEWFAQPVRSRRRETAARPASSSPARASADPAATDSWHAAHGRTSCLPADMVVKALGQEPLLELLRACRG